MRPVIMFNFITLDGMFEGPNGDISWHNTDEEFNEYAIEQTGWFGAIIFGRVTYEMMASYWPTEMALKDDPEVAKLMNKAQKLVFSRTLEKADWENTTLVKGNIADEINKLKQQPGNPIAVFGSGNLSTTLTNLGLIDEYRIMVNPIILGKGTPLFHDIEKSVKLKLVDSRVFKSGNVLLNYQPVRD